MTKIYQRISAICLWGALLISAASFAQDDDFQTDTYARLRLGFHSHNNFYRQILIGFQNDSATEGIDPGFDAVNVFNLPNDFYFLCDNTELFIQGVGYYNVNNVYPLGVRSNADGMISIGIDAAENWDPAQEVYIYDAETDTYHNIKNGAYTVNVGVGTFNNRFSLRFSTQSTLGVNPAAGMEQIKMAYLGADKALSIVNNTATKATSVSLVSMNGQKVAEWNIEKMNQSNLLLPVSNLATGVYVATLNTSNGNLTTKILLK